MSHSITVFIAAWLAAAAAHAQLDGNVLVPPYTGEKGCWVSVFSDQNFRGEAAQLDGPTFAETFETSRPVTEPDLRDVGGQEFLKRMQSLIVGPRARLITYDGQWFSGREIILQPGTKVPDLAQLRFAKRIESLKVQCDVND